jgi:hypothetical protein
LTASFSALTACAYRLDADKLIRRHQRPLETGADRVRRRRHDRQTIGPAAAVIQLLNGADIVRLVNLRCQLHCVLPNLLCSAIHTH